MGCGAGYQDEADKKAVGSFFLKKKFFYFYLTHLIYRITVAVEDALRATISYGPSIRFRMCLVLAYTI